jgi:hypothetical protein
MNAPKRCTARQFAQVGITLVRKTPLVMQCKQCGAEWHVDHLRLLKIPYWRCWNDCNAPDHHPSVTG